MTDTDLVSLRKQAHRTLHLPPEAQKVLEGYQHIRIGGATAPCTYHINPGIRFASPVLLGKGRPEEIEKLAATIFKQYALRVEGSTERLRSFLLACGIGVDCSGFAAWILNGVTKAELGRPIWRCLHFPGMRRNLVSKVRPITNISARLLTGTHNARPLDTLSAIRPGDLLCVADWHHVIIVTEVGQDKDGRALYFQYAQSSCMYGAESGVRTGHAVITNPDGPLAAQEWFDNFEQNVVKQHIAEGGKDSQAVRLKALMPQQ